LIEENECFSDDELQEGLRPDGYEEDGFVTQDKNIFILKRPRKEERYPLKATRRRCDMDSEPIIFSLPACVHFSKNLQESEFNRFVKSRAGLVPRLNTSITSEEPRQVNPPNVKKWLRKFLAKKRKRMDPKNVFMIKSRGEASGKVEKRTRKLAKIT